MNKPIIQLKVFLIIMTFKIMIRHHHHHHHHHHHSVLEWNLKIIHCSPHLSVEYTPLTPKNPATSNTFQTPWRFFFSTSARTPNGFKTVSPSHPPQMERRVERLTLAGATSCYISCMDTAYVRGNKKNTKIAGYKIQDSMDSANFWPEDVLSGMYLANKVPCRAKVSHKATEPHLLAAKKETWNGPKTKRPAESPKRFPMNCGFVNKGSVSVGL